MICAMRLEIVGAQEQLLARGEEDVAVFQEATEGDVLRVGKRRAVGPGLGIVLGQENLAVAESEGLVVALRIDVGPSGARRNQKCLVLANCSVSGAVGKRQGSPELPAVATAATVVANWRRFKSDCDLIFHRLVGLQVVGS